jgi:hypothetical protein
VSCNSPCTTASLNPSGSMEGLYTIVAPTAIRAEDGTPLASEDRRQFRVPAYENDLNSGCAFTFAGLDSPWACTGGELGTVNPQRCDLTDNESTATSNEVRTFRADTAAPFVATFRRRLSLNHIDGDFGKVEVLVGGSPTGLPATYMQNTGMASDQIPFTGAGTQQVALRFTLHVEPQPNADPSCDVSAGSGFFVDDLRVVRAAP